MRRYWVYLKQVWAHIREVRHAARELGVPWLGLLHDWSKLAPGEFGPYARFFYSADGSKRGREQRTDEERTAFDRAWNLHQKRNKHHWQHWNTHRYEDKQKWALQEVQPGTGLILAHDGKPFLVEHEPTTDESGQLMYRIAEALNNMPTPLEMPERYVREMVSDWIGAGRTYGGPGVREWYAQNKWRMMLHPETRKLIERLLEELP